MILVITEEALPPLDWLRAFEAAARLGGFTAAGQALGLTQAAISQQIAKLERHLGKALFYRRPRRVVLTEDGAAYLPHVQAAFAALARSTRDLFARRARASVTLRCPISFASLWLAPRLARLAAALPQVRLSLATVHLPEDYARDQDELEIRFGGGDWPGRDALRLAEESLVPVAAPSLARSDVRDWTRLPLLGVIGPREMWADWFAAAGRAPPPEPLLRFDTFIAAFEAAKAGAGVLLGSRPLIDSALESGALRLLADTPLATARAHYLLLPRDGAARPAVADLAAWFRRECGTSAPGDAATAAPLVPGRPAG